MTQLTAIQPTKAAVFCNLPIMDRQQLVEARADRIDDIIITRIASSRFDVIASIYIHFELVGYATFQPVAATEQHRMLERPGVVLGCPDIEGDVHGEATISSYVWEGFVWRDGQRTPLLLCLDLGNLQQQVWGVLRSDREDINCPF
jgi:hypothetical protein